MTLFDPTFGHGDDAKDFRAEYEAQISDFNRRQKAMFDKFFKAPPLSNITSVKTGKKSGIDASHISYIKAYEDAINKMNRQVKKNKVASDQSDRIGRRQNASERARLKIRQESKGGSTKSTLSGRYTNRKGINSLKINSGVQL